MPVVLHATKYELHVRMEFSVEPCGICHNLCLGCVVPRTAQSAIAKQSLWSQGQEYVGRIKTLVVGMVKTLFQLRDVCCMLFFIDVALSLDVVAESFDSFDDIHRLCEALVVFQHSSYLQ